jgi:hypothetical protein
VLHVVLYDDLTCELNVALFFELNVALFFELHGVLRVV